MAEAKGDYNHSPARVISGLISVNQTILLFETNSNHLVKSWNKDYSHNYLTTNSQLADRGVIRKEN